MPIRVSSGCVPGGHPARTVFSCLCVRSGAAQQEPCAIPGMREEARRKRAPDGRPGVCYRCIDETTQRLRPGKLTAARCRHRADCVDAVSRSTNIDATAQIVEVGWNERFTMPLGNAPVVRWLVQRPPGTGRVIRLGVYTYAESDIDPIQYFIRRLSDLFLD
ncbi:hypothetical protein [Burkholderia sp. Tr-20390]|uniref:hypothetical protein n=1 Tax=Burkholderia sp. Tr-20390 TaxID=2703904 RepID=UPI0019823834|nr:hypothetical protein [Burkholderia sp. Tr-20390]MBN3735253.1 hypothetical protein [Burkholderia sp. Tr-20390]